MKNNFNVLIYLRASKMNSKNEAPIYGRIILNGKRVEISLQHYVKVIHWDKKQGRIKRTNCNWEIINETIDTFRERTYKVYHEYKNKDSFIDLNLLRNIVLGNDPSKKTLNDVFEFQIDIIKSRLGVDYKSGTLKHYITTKSHISDFVYYRYLKSDIYISELNYSFINEFENYLKTIKNNGQNSTFKHIQRLKKIIKLAIANDWIEKDPFMKHSIKQAKTNRDYLTETELKHIENKDFSLARLNEVRDFFVFSCYTGISFQDLYDLERDCLNYELDGEVWIREIRIKTGNSYSILLLPKAIEIINKYDNKKSKKANNKLLPLPSNQKINAYLKEIATLCSISKNLTFHVARHTFATTVTLTNGVPIETVSRMLGHTSIRTTQIYGRIVDKKISTDMKLLKIKLLSNEEEGKMQSFRAV